MSHTLLSLEILQTDGLSAVNQIGCDSDPGNVCAQFTNNGTGTLGAAYADGIALGQSSFQHSI
jgi:hypothetical protein